jgi:hypothetical protein
MATNRGLDETSQLTFRVDEAPKMRPTRRRDAMAVLHRNISLAVKSTIVIAALLLSVPQCLAAAGEPGQSPDTVVKLTSVQQQAGQIAEKNGDRDYLMVDKHFGKIILFQDGKAVFKDSALSGESRTDRLPPGALAKKFSQLSTLADKVTPAGRFTVSRDIDKNYGPVLDINEIPGRDWTISIHQLYIGKPSERRAYRLESQDHLDNHITHGCINVSKQTMRFILDNLPKKGATPLYVMPHDLTRISDFLARHD